MDGMARVDDGHPTTLTIAHRDDSTPQMRLPTYILVIRLDSTSTSMYYNSNLDASAPAQAIVAAVDAGAGANAIPWSLAA